MPARYAVAYTLIWAVLLLVALVVALRRARGPRRLALFTAAYWRWLMQPWKLATFAVALGAMVLAAPYTGDPTWDYVTGGVQSALTFLTAPWAFGVVYRSVRRIGRFDGAALYVAACLWLLSSSWFYDAYLWWRDGRYPSMWIENLMASPALYLLAGVLWGLGPSEHPRPLLAVRLSAHAPEWPTREARPTAGVLAVAGAVILFTSALMAPFAVNVWEALKG